MAAIRVTIINAKGLHARAAAKFVKTVAQYTAKVNVTRVGTPPPELTNEGGQWTVTGSSILGLMMLGADKGTELDISAEGEQAQASINALVALINDKFGEEE